jgi:hypothetical protein
MGGRIEDGIFNLIDYQKLSVSEIVEGLGKLRPAYERSYGTVDKHLRKMVQVSHQLTREKDSRGVYVYWNPRTIEDKV